MCRAGLAKIAHTRLRRGRPGAAIVHCHMRDPQTGVPSRDLALYAELTDRVRSADVSMVLTLTYGMGGDIVLGGAG